MKTLRYVLSIGAIFLIFISLLTSCKKDDLTPEQEKFNEIKDKVHFTFKENGKFIDFSQQAIYSIYTDGSMHIEAHDSSRRFILIINDIKNPSTNTYKIHYNQTQSNDTAWHINITKCDTINEFISGTFYANKLSDNELIGKISITEGTFFVGKRELMYAD